MKNNIDDCVKLADIRIKNQQILETKKKLEIEQQRVENDIRKTRIDEINSLGDLLTSLTIDESKPHKDFPLKPLFDQEETNFIKKTLVKKLKQL